jgi:hypothetical protein
MRVVTAVSVATCVATLSLATGILLLHRLLQRALQRSALFQTSDGQREPGSPESMGDRRHSAQVPIQHNLGEQRAAPSRYDWFSPVDPSKRYPTITRSERRFPCEPLRCEPPKPWKLAGNSRGGNKRFLCVPKCVPRGAYYALMYTIRKLRRNIVGAVRVYLRRYPFRNSRLAEPLTIAAQGSQPIRPFRKVRRNCGVISGLSLHRTDCQRTIIPPQNNLGGV